MMTLYEVLDLCGDEKRLKEWLLRYGILLPAPVEYISSDTLILFVSQGVRERYIPLGIQLY